MPDFLSQPWEGGKNPSPFHTLKQAVTQRLSCLHSLQRSSHSSVIVLPSWQGHVALQHHDGAAGLWAVSVTPNETALQVVRRALCPILLAQCKRPIMSCVARSGRVLRQRQDALANGGSSRRVDCP